MNWYIFVTFFGSNASRCITEESKVAQKTEREEEKSSETALQQCKNDVEIVTSVHAFNKYCER